MKRLALLACVAAFVASSTAALAAPAGAIRIRLEGIQRGAIIEGGVSFAAQASSAAGIKRLEISIEDSVVAAVEPSNFKQEVELPYDWTTMFEHASAELAPNGEYAIKVLAVANGNADERLVANVTVDNPAAMPTGLVATPGAEQVELSWNPNPEPDLLGYRVERMVSGSFVVVGETTETSYLDTVDPGEHSYRIVAVRNSTARSSGRPSVPSAEVTVSVAAPSTDAEGEPHFGVGPPAATKGAGTRGAIGGASFAPRGLPSGAALPGSIGLPDVPEVTEAAAPGSGTYEETLPYDLPEGGIPLSASQPELGESWTLLPSDGLRWVALGSLFLAIATLLRLVARRLEAVAGPPELKL